MSAMDEALKGIRWEVTADNPEDSKYAEAHQALLQWAWDHNHNGFRDEAAFVLTELGKKIRHDLLYGYRELKT